MAIQTLNRKWISPLVLCVLLLIILLPLVLQNDIVKTIKTGSDMKATIAVIKGETDYTTYLGQKIIATLFKPLANYAHLDTIYLIFSFALLIASIGALFFIVKSLVNMSSALLMIPLALFCTTGVLSLFRYGVIYNIINMYLILPFAILFAIKWLMKDRILYCEISLALLILFSVFHYTGIYLSPVIGLMLVVYVLYCLIMKRKIMLRAVIFGNVMLIINLVIYYTGYDKGYIGSVEEGLALNRSFGGYLYYVFIQSINHLSLITLVLFIVMGMWLYNKRKQVKLSTETKLFLFVATSFVVVLFGVLVLHITDNVLFINRIMVDATTLLAIIIASVLGVLLKEQKTNTAYTCVYALVGIGVIPVLRVWL